MPKLLDMLPERPEHLVLLGGERRDTAGVGEHPGGHSVQQVLARASVHGHGFDHPDRKDEEPPAVRAHRRHGQLAGEGSQCLYESWGQARRDHAEGNIGRVLDLCDHEVLERVGEEHSGIVALELVGRPLEMHEGVLSQLTNHALEELRRRRRSRAATPDDDDVDPQRLAGELQLREELVPATSPRGARVRAKQRSADATPCRSGRAYLGDRGAPSSLSPSARLSSSTAAPPHGPASTQFPLNRRLRGRGSRARRAGSS